MRAAVANSLLFASCLPGAIRWRLATRNVARAQERVLREILRKNAGSAFGREHGFSAVRSVCDYQERVPVRGYAEFEPYIERAAGGEASVLTAEPVQRFALSSGSTSASKRIPYTASLLRGFRRGLSPWIAGLFLQYPSLLSGNAYWQVTPAGVAAGTTTGGIPIGFGEDSEYFGKWSGALVRATLAVPEQVARIADVDEFRHETLRHLRDCRNLRFISVWNPSFLTLLLAERLGPAKLEATWPDLRVISCWTDASACEAAARLRLLFPHAEIQPKGLIATEGLMTFPWRAAGNALAIRSHFFEFLEGETPRLAHQLEPGRTYSIVLTTSGGMYRYRIGDLVEMTGHIGQCPLLRFVGKEDGVVDLVGEKLNNLHVQRAAEMVFAAYGLHPRFWMVAPERDEPPHYSLYVQSDSPAQDDLAAALDAALGENFHYGYARRLGQLAPLRLFPIDTESDPEAAYLRARASNGQRIGGIKRPYLERDGGWSSVFASSRAWSCGPSVRQ